MNELANLVRAERLRRGWSVRQAAAAAGISNTWWGKFEDGRQPLTPMIANGVAKAYDWPTEWAAAPASMPRPEEVSRLFELVADLAERVAEMSRSHAAMGAALERLIRQQRQGDGG